MNLHFYKYQGTGNDFVMVDNRELLFDSKQHELVKKLCDRRFGIGADGFILLQNKDGYDFEMVYYNADGNFSSMCGNGGRCIVKFAYDLGVIGETTTFLAVDGPHEAFIKEGKVHLKMIDVNEVEQNKDFCFMNTGSPHYVTKVKEIKNYPVFEKGKAIRNNERFKEKGTNVNFIEQLGETLWVRTYERGVEDETYSCGTGVTAAAIAASMDGMKSPVNIKTLGGELAVSFKKQDKGYQDIFLIGPAERVFEGNIQV